MMQLQNHLNSGLLDCKPMLLKYFKGPRLSQVSLVLVEPQQRTDDKTITLKVL